MNASLPKIRLGTRGSQLALAQSGWVKSSLESLGVPVELIMIRTEGDVNQRSLTQIGGQGVFTKQIQQALLEHRIDLAVHSLKDLPTKQEPELQILAVPRREETADVLITANGTGLAQLAPGAIVGTGSLRRSAQLKRLRCDLNVREIRGNVDTRLAKLDQGEFAAIVLAAAGLNRLGLGHRIAERFPVEQMLPAIGQGALGLEVRAGDRGTAASVEQLNDWESFCTAMAERAMLRQLQAGCLSAVGADCKIVSGQLCLSGIVLSPDGSLAVLASQSGPMETLDQAESLGAVVAAKLLERGAGELLKLGERK